MQAQRGASALSVCNAAIQVLREAGAPLHAQEIATRVLARKLWQTSGKTPAATVSARLYADIKKNREASPFVHTGPQTFGLRPGAAHSAPVGTKAKDKDVKLASAATCSFTDAAEKVLDQFGKKQPMHYRAITDKARGLRMLRTSGQTPEATMYAQILTEIRRYQKRGEQPRFVQHGKGYVGLSRWMGHGLAFEIEQHNKEVRKALRKRLFEMRWGEFEELIARLLAEVGFEDVDMHPRGNDGGIDVRATLVVGDVIRTRMAVQVKKWKHNVQAPVVQQVRGSLGTHEQGLIITTSDFSPGARAEAARENAVPVALMNGEQFVLLLAEHGIGLTRQSHDLLELAGDEQQSG